MFSETTFRYRDEDIYTIVTAVPYDTSLLNQSGTMLGRLPEADNEILITTTVAANMRGLLTIDEDSYELVFALLENEVIGLEHSYYDEVDGYISTEIGNYTIVGMTIEQASNTIYLNYEEAIDIFEVVSPDASYKGAAIAYLNTTNENDIDEFKQTLRDDYDLVIENFFQSITGSVEDFMFNALKVLIAVASITLIVSGILIGLVVYTSIIERIKEIGILTAIGARANNIVGIFIAESAMIGLLSSIIATMFALLISVVLNKAFDGFIAQPLEMITQGDLGIRLFAPSVLVIAIVLLFSIVYSMLAGLIPSLRAARLNAVKALRKE
jgi:putative ABC transport system permease protein